MSTPRPQPDDKLLDLLYGEVLPEDAEALQALVNTDPVLRERLEAWTSVRRAMATLPEPEPDPQVHYNILRAARQQAAPAEAPNLVASNMVVFFGPKGGTGSTSMAVNVAGLLARYGRNAVVVDMDLQLGAVPVSLNIKPERSVAELVVESTDSGGGPIQSGLDRHSSGLSMVAQGDRIEELGAISAERMPRFFESLGHTFEFVIVDGLRDFGDLAVAAMDLAHTIVLCITQDVPAVRAAARSLRIFRRLGYGPDRVKVLVNRYHKKAPVSLDAIQNALGQPVEALVANDFRLMEDALNQGVLVTDLKPGAPMSRDLDALTRKLARMPDAGGGGGFFARLFGR
ncbi:MAG: AAA family ATPase [Myxococcales bacterium]|nr:AAA family ATPase [Myxococcales bacterium]